MIKDIIFDWSGVINDNVDDFIDHINEMFVEAGGRKITRNELRQKWTQPYMNFYNQYFPEWTLDDQKARYQKNVQKFTTRRMHEGMGELLAQLKQSGRSLYVLSGDSLTTLNVELDEYGVRERFDEIISDSHNKIDDLKKLINDRGLNPHSTAFIGDTTHEVECSKETGIISIAVTWGMSSKDRLSESKPDYLIETIRELDSVLIDH